MPNSIQYPTAFEIVSNLQNCPPIAHDLSYLSADYKTALLEQVTQFAHNYFISSDWGATFKENQERFGIPYKKENFINHASKTLSHLVQQALTDVQGMNERLASYYKEGGGIFSSIFSSKQVSKCPDNVFNLETVPADLPDSTVITCQYMRQVFDLYKSSVAQHECGWPEVLPYVSVLRGDFPVALHFTYTLERVYPERMPIGSVTEDGKPKNMEIGSDILTRLCQKQPERKVCETKDWQRAFSVGSETLFPAKMSEAFEDAVQNSPLSRSYFYINRLIAKQGAIMEQGSRYAKLKDSGESDSVRLGHAQLDSMDANKEIKKPGGLFDVDTVLPKLKQAGTKIINWEDVKFMTEEEQKEYIERLAEELGDSKDSKKNN